MTQDCKQFSSGGTESKTLAGPHAMQADARESSAHDDASSPKSTAPQSTSQPSADAGKLGVAGDAIRSDMQPPAKAATKLAEQSKKDKTKDAKEKNLSKKARQQAEKKAAKSAGSNKTEQKQAQTLASPSAPTGKSNRTKADELKLFQKNRHLLEQQDPIEQLHLQLNQLIQADDERDVRRAAPNKLAGAATATSALASNKAHIANNHLSPFPGQSSAPAQQLHHQRQQHEQELQQQQQLRHYQPLPLQSELPARHQPASGQQATEMQHKQEQGMRDANPAAEQPFYNNQANQFNDSNVQEFVDATCDSGENMFTVKKGVLWQQQSYDKFHQRIFSRWKKRYFILTTDYLVCFKRISPKVGRSEMGKFLYKVSRLDFYLFHYLRC